MRLSGDVLDSPVGALGVAVDDDGALTRVTFLGEEGLEAFARRVAGESDAFEHDPAAVADARAQLTAWFRGERRDFDLPLHPRGTAFQLRVWEELRAIPFGATISYGELARRVGDPGASRAVGRANHENPLPIVVPCHRVVGADGALVGFGGGLDAKRRLVDLERGQTALPFG